MRECQSMDTDKQEELKRMLSAKGTSHEDTKEMMKMTDEENDKDKDKDLCVW